MTDTIILQALKTYLATYEGLKEGAPLSVDSNGTQVTEYSIIPLPGPRIVDTYLNDATVREFPFAFQSAESTADELERIENNGFFEALAQWFETQTKGGTFPDLGSGKTPTAIEAVQWAFLYQEGESKTGAYQIQCKLTYDQEP